MTTTGTTNAALDLDAITSRVPAVYDGPWYAQLADDGRWLVGYPTDNPKAGLVATVPDYGEQLAEFIAAARTDVPALVAEIRRLREQLAHAGIGCNCCWADGHNRRCGRTATTEVDVAPYGTLAVAETCKARINGTAVAR